MLQRALIPMTRLRDFAGRLPPLPPLPRPVARTLGRTLDRIGGIALHPLELALTAALRRLADRRPDVFERLGPAARATIIVDPAEWPIEFELCPDGARGTVRIIAAGGDRPWDARIEAPLAMLLGLFEGSEDGDAAFFASELWIEGDTVIVLSLRNALEEADMSLSDLVPLPAPLRGWLAASRGAMPEAGR